MSVALHHHPPWQRVWVDDMIGAYVDWREECLAVQAAYERWSSAPPKTRSSPSQPIWRRWTTRNARHFCMKSSFSASVSTLAPEQREAPGRDALPSAC